MLFKESNIFKACAAATKSSRCYNSAVQKLEEIQECHLVSGDFDYLLKTRVPDMSAYRKLLGETLLRLPGVNDTRTYVVMEEVKQSNRLVIKTR